MTYLLSVGAGALTALSPCILPVLPIMAGSSMSERKSGPIYIAAGMTASLVVMGLVFSSVVTVLGLREETIRQLSAWLLVIFGVVLAGPKLKELINARLQGLGSKAFKASDTFNSKDRMGQFGIGFLLGAAWSPCVGPTLGIALGLAGTQGGLLQAATMMTLFGIGLSLPLLAIAYGFRGYIQNKKVSFMKFNNIGMKVLGGSIALVGLMMLTGFDKILESYFYSVLPNWFLQLSSFI